MTSDGIRIAYAVTGSGPPLVRVATWVSHLEDDTASPVTRHLLAELARDRAARLLTIRAGTACRNGM